MKSVIFNKKLVATAVAFVLTLSGCASITPPPFKTKAAEDGDRVSNAIGNAKEDLGESAVEYTSSDVLLSEPSDPSDPLPDNRIAPFSFSNTNAYNVLRGVLGNSGISILYSADNAASAAVLRRVISAQNMSGSLGDVIEQLSKMAGFTYTYDESRHALTIAPDKQYVVSIPPINELFESLHDMMKTMGATDIYVDKSSRAVSYRANRLAQIRIERYLTWLRETRSEILYDIYIWEVVLNKDSQMGVNWNQFATSMNNGANGVLNLGMSGKGPSVANGLSFSAVYTGKKFAMDVLTSFLSTQGSLKTISQPRLAVLSGTAASFRNGQTINYVSQIGTTVTSGGTTTSNVTTGQVLAGVSLQLTGDFADGTIYTNVKLTMNDLQKFNQVTALGTDIQLPQTADREVQSSLRARPGDTLLMAGINSSRYTKDIAGLGNMGNFSLPLLSSTTADDRNELVVVLRPRVVHFTKKPAVAQPEVPTKEVEKSNVEAALNSRKPEDSSNKFSVESTGGKAVDPPKVNAGKFLVEAK